jgi:hypothetical protein
VARTWLSIQVELVGGMHAHDLWPRPGRVLLARPGMTFRTLADAINDAFARWELSHLHAFTLADGTRVTMRTPWDELDDDSLDDTRTTLSRLSLGEQFAFEFDFGDSWMHLCTVAERKVDPMEVYGVVPDRPVPYFGWGAIPDQHGRRWAGDDGSSPVPPQPDPPLSDLPNLHYTWGERAFPAVPEADDDEDATVVTGPWTHPTRASEAAHHASLGWTPADTADLRSAVYRGDHAAAIDLLLPRDALVVAHHVAPALLYAVEFERRLEAMQIAVVLTDELTDRDWPGDAELVTEIERALVPPGDLDLRPVPVDLEELLMHLDGPPDLEGDWRLEVATGRLWPADPELLLDEQEPDDFEDPDAFVTIHSLGSAPGYRDMRDFIATVEDPATAERLRRAIDGRGAFRRFRDVVFQDDELRHAWTLLSSERALGRARRWLADAGLRPAIG